MAAVETRLRAAVMVGCKASFRLEAASRDGVVAVADEGTLPVWTEHNTAFKKQGIVGLGRFLLLY